MTHVLWWNWKLSLQVVVMAVAVANDNWWLFALGAGGGLIEHVAVYFDKELGLR